MLMLTLERATNSETNKLPNMITIRLNYSLLVLYTILQ